MPDLICTIVYAAGGSDKVTFQDDGIAKWNGKLSDATIANHKALIDFIKILREAYLALGAKSITIAPPAPGP